MNKTRKCLNGAAAALTLSLAMGAYAQDADRAERLPSPDPDRIGTIAAPEQQSSVTKANKASGLIGMDVRNMQNEKLGDVQDVVLDLRSGKVSYVVLSVGGFLGIGDRHVAVPPSAFTAAADHDHLILNADKAKIQNAPSFTKDNWPDVNNSGTTWTADSRYWLSDSTAQGTAAGSVTGSGTDVARGQRVQDHSSPSTSTATDTDRNTTFRGRITRIDPENRTMTVQGAAGSRNFKFDENAMVTLRDDPDADLNDLKEGFPVVVVFRNEGGSYVAQRVTRSEAPEVK